MIVTTGVRGAKRILADSASPVDIVSGQQLRLSGRAELSEAITKLLPSFNFGTNQSGINSIVRPVTNRGLGPAYTLVLVNGKRRHNGSLLTNGGGDTSGINAVDLDMIPLSAVDHIEVLRDSAAAQYGSDAVAGVVNVVLKSADHGVHLGVLGGALGSGKGDLSTVRGEADAGFELPGGGFAHLSADIRKRGMAWWNFPATNGVIYSPASDPRNASWNRDGAHNGDPQIRALNFSYNVEKPLEDAASVYSYATFGLRNTAIGNNFRRPNGLASIAQIFPDGYYPLNNTSETDFQIVAGGKGRAFDWSFDLSSSYGINHNLQYSDLTINPSLGAASPTRFDNLATYQFEQWVNNLDVTRSFDLGLTKKPIEASLGAEYRIDKFSTFAGDPRSYINGGYVFQAGDQPGNSNIGKPASVGAQAGVTLTPADAVVLTRDSVAGYGEIGVYPIENWFVNASVRGEHYSDSSGNTVSGKINSRYDITPEIAVRGTVGTGFRAPSLTQIGYAQTDNRTNINAAGVVVPSLSKLARNNSALAHALGAQDLKPEHSENVSLGVVLQPWRNVSVTVDGYRIGIKDRIIRTGYLYGPAVTPILVANGLTGTEWLQYFANGADTRTTGVDLVADATQDYGDFGVVRWTAAFNWNETEIVGVKSAPAVLSSLGANPGGSLVWFPRSSRGDLTVANPHTKLILAARWLISDFEINARTTRYGEYVWQRTENPAQDVSFGAKWITDLDVTYEFLPGLKGTLGATNLFDVRPDKNGPGDPNTGASTFSYGPAPFAPSGGFYYAKLTYDIF
ncbi:TonB-dependent receptor plug domain-containing protein [Methylosinus sp. Sm6]|uniref:TonB-dependent receptor plug domain-containing protein n=1 Tax=Methylosinus sp. Sm6 TaxID=2866948 RepID=UPI00351D9822